MKERSKKKITWAQPDLSTDDFNSLSQCFDNNWISQGPRVEEFEVLVAKYSNRKYCVAVNSGSSALVCLLIALGINKNSEVIIPMLSFIAVPYAVTTIGAIPVLADIDRRTGMISTESIRDCISEKTKAVIAIDYSGFANEWGDLNTFCMNNGIDLIIDSASSFLAENSNGPAGSYGKAAIFSFHTAKPFTTGEGGAIVTDDEDLALLLKRIRNYGEVRGLKYSYDILGSNYRMTDVAASLGISQIKRKDQILNLRRQVIEQYMKNDTIKTLALSAYKIAGVKSNGFTFTILTEHREKLRKGLFENGIETRVMWPYTIDQQLVYQVYPLKIPSSNEGSNYFSRSCLSLPVHSGLGLEEIDYIIREIEMLISRYTG